MTKTTTILLVSLVAHLNLLLFTGAISDNDGSAAVVAANDVADNFIINHHMIENSNDNNANATSNNNNNNSSNGNLSKNPFRNISPTTFEVENSSAAKRHRGKRYLDFNKGTRMSWRGTVKNNILKVNTLWGYGYGFRMNYPFPDKADRLRPFFKRDTYYALEAILDGHGFDGRACLLKCFCTAMLDAESELGGGMLFKLLKLLFRFGFDGQACILKAFCTAHMIETHIVGREGMLLKLLRYVFTLDSHDKRHFPFLRLEYCGQILHSHCPLSFNNISPFTDDV